MSLVKVVQDSGIPVTLLRLLPFTLAVQWAHFQVRVCSLTGWLRASQLLVGEYYLVAAKRVSYVPREPTLRDVLWKNRVWITVCVSVGRMPGRGLAKPSMRLRSVTANVWLLRADAVRDVQCWLCCDLLGGVRPVCKQETDGKFMCRDLLADLRVLQHSFTGTQSYLLITL